MTTQRTPPGWYPDGHGGERYWDGTQWTEHYRTADGRRHDPGVSAGGPTAVPGASTVSSGSSGPAVRKNGSGSNMLIFGLIGALLLLCCGGGAVFGAIWYVSGDDSSQPQTQEPAEPGASTTQEPPSQPGEVMVDGVAVTIEGAETREEIAGAHFDGRPRNDVFVVVRITARNTQQFPAMLSSSRFTLVDENGAQIDGSSLPTIGITDDELNVFLIEALTADESMSGHLVFDVASETLPGLQLRIEPYGDGEAQTVPLNL